MLQERIDKYIKEHQEETLELLRTLAQIPAPSGCEEKRAVFCKEWLEEQGAKGVYIDDALNVVYPVELEEGQDAEVFMAHMDVVFPDEEQLPFADRDGRVYCPGVGDDTACLVCLLMAGKFLAECKKRNERLREKSSPGILLVCDSGEEGLGNLRGVREICRAYYGRIAAVCAFDSTLDKIVVKAVGSIRYQVRVCTEGGHSFRDFGKANAIERLCRIIEKLYQLPLPEEGTTTWNVGKIHGGTSVNALAQSAEMLFEFRSDREENLMYMKEGFQKALEEERTAEADVLWKEIGSRPCGRRSRQEEQEALVERAACAVRQITGKEPKKEAGSTDCNIPLSQGIPSVCVGCYYGAGAHTRGEFVEKASLIQGLGVVLNMIIR